MGAGGRGTLVRSSSNVHTSIRDILLFSPSNKWFLVYRVCYQSDVDLLSDIQIHQASNPNLSNGCQMRECMSRGTFFFVTEIILRKIINAFF